MVIYVSITKHFLLLLFCVIDPSSPTIKKELLRNISECPATPEQWDRLLSRSLEGRDFDLMVHSYTDPMENGINEEGPVPSSA